MAISSSGVGSGLDVNGIVSQLMSLERQPVTRLESRKTTIDSQISALGKVKSAIAALQTASEAIASTDSIYAYKGTLADTDIASATATSDAVAGSYSIEVERLATTHKLLSSATADPSAGGTLSIEIGSTSTGSFVRKSGTSAVSVTINAGATLATVAAEINGADAGVSATVVNGASGTQLVITSNTSGEASQVKITTAMSGFAFNPDAPVTPGNLTQNTAALDAILKVDGITIADTTSNVVVDAIDGVTLTLKQTNDDDPTTLTVANDTSNLQSKLEAFVKAYNEVRSLLKTLSKFDSTGKTTGVLNGDSTVSSIMSQLRTKLSTVPSAASSAYQTLISLGINSNSDGTLELDSDVLQTAIDTDFTSLAKSVAAYGTEFDTLTTAMNDIEGLVSTRSSGLTSSYKLLGTRIEEYNTRLAIVEKRYRQQFTSLDTMMAQFQTTSSFLSRQLPGLNFGS